MPGKSDDEKKLTCATAGEIAQVLGISERRVRELVAEGLPRKSLPKRRFEYHIPTVVLWWVSRAVATEAEKHERPRDVAGKPSPSGLDRLHELAARKKELEIEKLEGTLVPLLEVREAYDVACGVYRDAIEMLAKQFGNEVIVTWNDALVKAEDELDQRFPSAK